MLRNPPYLVGKGSDKADDPPLYAEFGHAGAQGTGFEAKEVGRTGRPFDSPTSLLKDANDVFLLHFLEALNRRGRLIRASVQSDPPFAGRFPDCVSLSAQ